jgi:hypothetical protein
MSKLISGLLLLSALMGCQGKADSPVPTEVRSAVFAQLTKAGIDSKEVAQAKDLFKAVSLTSQGQVTWIADFSLLPSPTLCGTGGCLLQVWVKNGASHYTLAFDRQVLGHSVVRHDNGQGRLALELHGALCGGTGSVSCRYAFEWRRNADTGDSYFMATGIQGKLTRYEGPLVQALPVREPVDGEVTKALGEYRAACTAAGGTAEAGDALPFLPDLNRDGLRELLLDAGAAYCEHDGAPIALRCRGDLCKSRLFSEKGGQGWHAVWTEEPFAYAIDVGEPEARLLVRPADCDVPGTGRCAERSLVWQDATGRFVTN